MRYHKYKDYNQYVEKQTRWNKIKEDWVWVWDGTIKSVAEDYGDDPAPKFILCHGTRGGWEQKYFKECYPDAEVLGTEISETATKYEMTIQQDFTKPVEGWIGRADIVYSNSIDHTIDIHTTLQTWREQLSEDGTMYLEIGNQVWGGRPSESDPLAITEEEFSECLYANRLKIELWWETEALKHRPRSSDKETVVTSKVFALKPY